MPTDGESQIRMGTLNCRSKSNAYKLPQHREMSDRAVYKYRSWNDDNHRRMLGNNEIYLASPSEFNDPFDCAIIPDYDLLDTVEKQETFSTKFIAAIKLTNPNADEVALGKMLTAKFKDPPTAICELKSLWQIFQNHAYGIFSLSRNWDSILMWSHYSDHHRGFCVGFDMEKLKQLNAFGAGSFISYSDEFPQIDPLDYNDNAMFKEIATKASNWSYEDEYRLLSLIRPGANNRVIRVPDYCLKEVIIGTKFPRDQVEKIKDLIGRRDIGLFQAVAIDKQFKLTRNRI